MAALGARGKGRRCELHHMAGEDDNNTTPSIHFNKKIPCIKDQQVTVSTQSNSTVYK